MVELVSAVDRVLKAIDECQDEINWCAFFKPREAPGGDGWMAYIERTGNGCGGKDVRGNNRSSAEEEFKDQHPKRKLHGHHIVIKKGSGKIGKLSAIARQVLCKHGIDPYTACENLIIAPLRSHSIAYAAFTCRELKKADLRGRSEVIAALKRIGDVFADNEIPKDETCK